MLDRNLNAITDSADYLTAISLFQVKGPMKKKDVEKLLAVYARYVPGADDPTYARACLAVDLLTGSAERACFAPLELGEGNLGALFAAKEILERSRREVTGEEMKAVAAQVRDESLELYARVILARTVLNTVSCTRNFAQSREEVAALADFLAGCGAETLDRYAELVADMRYNLRQMPKEA